MNLELFGTIYTFSLGLNKLIGLQEFLNSNRRTKIIFINCIDSKHPYLLWLLMNLKYGQTFIKKFIDDFVESNGFSSRTTQQEIKQMKLVCKECNLPLTASVEQINIAYEARAKNLREWADWSHYVPAQPLSVEPFVSTQEQNEQELRKVYESFNTNK